MPRKKDMETTCDEYEDECLVEGSMGSPQGNADKSIYKVVYDTTGKSVADTRIFTFVFARDLEEAVSTFRRFKGSKTAIIVEVKLLIPAANILDSDSTFIINKTRNMLTHNMD